jgi:hypothetical protein
MTDWLASGAAGLEHLLSELPEEWLLDSYGDSRCGLDISGLPGVLSSFSRHPDFWNIPEP